MVQALNGSDTLPLEDVVALPKQAAIDLVIDTISLLCSCHHRMCLRPLRLPPSLRTLPLTKSTGYKVPSFCLRGGADQATRRDSKKQPPPFYSEVFFVLLGTGSRYHVSSLAKRVGVACRGSRGGCRCGLCRRGGWRSSPCRQACIGATECQTCQVRVCRRRGYAPSGQRVI